MRPATRIAISLLLTALFTVLFVRGFDLRQASGALASAAPGLIALSAAINLAAYLVRVWRWRVLLSPVRPAVPLRSLVPATFIGFMVSFLVPFRLGEIVRPVYLARRERLPAGAAIATIAVERLLDAVTVMALFLVFMASPAGAAVIDAPAAGNAAALLRQGLFATCVMVGVLLPLLVALVTCPDAVAAGLHRLQRAWPSGPAGRLAAFVDASLPGLHVLRRGRALAAAVGLSFAMWLMIDFSVLCGTRAFGLDLVFFDMFLLMVPLAVGIAVPTPGGVGAYEWLAGLSLTGFWGVGAATAAATAIALHLATLVPTIGAGLLCMWHDGVRPAEMRRLASLQGAAAAPGAPGSAGAVGRGTP